MHRECRPQCGLTLAEVIVCLAILGVAVTAGLQTLGSFSVGSLTWQERSTGLELANVLMAQINALPFRDPTTATDVIGLDGSAEVAGDPRTYDDIDDYNGWSYSPPRDANAAVMTAYTGYLQKVSVAYVPAAAASGSPSLASLGLAANTFKKITVTISKEEKVLAELVSYRANQTGAVLVP